MYEIPIQELKRLVTETRDNLRLIRKDLDELKGVMDDGLKSPECSVCDEVQDNEQ